MSQSFHHRGRRSADLTYHNTARENKPTLRPNVVKKLEIPYGILKNKDVEYFDSSNEIFYPAEEYEQEGTVSTSEKSGSYKQINNNKNKAEENGEILNHMHALMDIIDSRIEGVEEIMSEMQKIIAQLSLTV